MELLWIKFIIRCCKTKTETFPLWLETSVVLCLLVFVEAVLSAVQQRLSSSTVELWRYAALLGPGYSVQKALCLNSEFIWIKRANPKNQSRRSQWYSKLVRSLRLTIIVQWIFLVNFHIHFQIFIVSSNILTSRFAVIFRSEYSFTILTAAHLQCRLG